MIQRFVTINGRRIALTDWAGDGRPLLLLHGNGYHGRTWNPVCRALLPEYRPIAVDWRGHGDSDPAPSYHGEDFASDLAALVPALGLDRPPVLAHSVGGITALVVAATSDLIGPLFAIDPIVRERGTAPGDFTQQMVDGARRRRAVWPSKAAVCESYAPRKPFDGWDAEVLDAYVDYGFADQPDGTVRLKCAPETEAEVFRVGVPHDPWPLLPNIRVPVLILRAEFSRVLPAAVIQEAATEIPGAVLRQVHGATHSLPMERPAFIADEARAFFTAASGRV